MADQAKPVDWAADVKRYVPDADDKVIAAIVRYCGIALRTRDASLVSFSDPAETGRVRDKFCRKKLALTQSDEEVDAAIAKVGTRMSDTTFRNRVTVYYLLAEHFGKLDLFGAAAPAAAPAAAAPLAAATLASAAAASETVAAAEPAAAQPQPSASEPASAAAPIAPLAMAAIPPAPLAGQMGQSEQGAHGVRKAKAKGGDDFVGFAALVFAGAATIMIVSAILGSYVGGRFDAEPAPAPAPAATAEPAAPPPPAPLPEGAGVVSEVIAGRPKVSVYFAVGKADIAPEFTAAVAPIKAWLDANPQDRVQLSGFTDPTGNAAANAELAKSRAQAVAAALKDEGVAAERMDLVKPAQSSDAAAAELSAARRVEITVTGS